MEIVNSIKNQKILIIFLVAFALRLTVFLVSRPWDIQVERESILLNDSLDYHRLAQCIVDNFTFCGDVYRTPGYPFFIAVFYAIFGAKPWVVIFAQIFVDLVTIYCIFKIGEMLFSRRVGMIAAMFFAIDPNSIFLTVVLYSEASFMLFLWASLYFYLRGLKLGEGWGFLIAGGMLALATLIRPVAQYYVFILLLFALLWPSRDRVVRLKCGFLFVLAFAITLSPWLYRNYALYDTVKVSSLPGENLLFWQVASTRAWKTHQSREAIAAEFMSQAKALGYSSEGGNPFANEAILQDIAVQYIKAHPLIYASRWLKGMIFTYTSLGSADITKRLGLMPSVPLPDTMATFKSDSERASNFLQTKSLPEIVTGLIVLVLLLINYSMFLLGAYVLIRHHQWSIFVLFVISIMYFTVTGGPTSYARYRLPIEPFYLLIGAVYIDQFLNLRAARNATKSKC